VIGVDIEKIKADPKNDELAGSICCDRELATLAGLPEPQRFVEFYRYWTLKEAYVKALGVGLSFPVQKVEVMPSTANPGNSPWSMSDLRVRGRWTAVSINDVCGYAAAAAVAGSDIVLRHRSWPNSDPL
jgi:4'-phosphopantetheinyl transferase